VRIAIADIGSNSTRLLIADVNGEHVTDEAVRRSVVTRLGKGVDADGALSHEGMQRVYDTLADFRELISEHDVEASHAVLTSAVRDAANGAEFAGTVKQRFGLEPHVLTGDEEARLTFLGAMSERDPDDDTPTLVIDIGGGSTEMVIGHGHDMSFHVSHQAGVVRQTERHIHSDPPEARALAAVAVDVEEIFKRGVPEHYRVAVRQAIAVAGTATSLGAIAQQLDPYDPERVHGYVLSAAEIKRLRDELAAMTLVARREVPGLDPARAPTIVAGVVILLEALALFGLDRVQVSEHDILRGAALELAA
jgi:exopolyphosphatase / guanosine-5'-triphosphate,3'-diphosphate pyrophosphatase